jgi:hypothetical protein
MSSLCSVNEKILKRSEQKRTEPAAATVCVLQPIILKDYRKKILCEILRILNGMAASAHKRKNRSPISAAELGERMVSFLLFAPKAGGGKDQAPAGGYKFVRFICPLVARSRMNIVVLPLLHKLKS